MSGCKDKRFEELLHAYELGMLSDRDCTQLEVHLLECSQCFARVERLEAAARLMRRDPDVRMTVGEIDEALETEGQALAEHGHSSRSRRVRLVLVPFSAVAALLFLFLILKDWTLTIRPTQEVTAAANRLAVITLDNLADPADDQKLAEIVTNLLITDLSESPSLQVVSSQRVYDILKLLGKEGTKGVDRQLASQVAEKAKVRWMVSGSIVQVQPGLALTIQVVDVSTGSVVGSQTITADSSETVFALADKLAAGIGRDLKLPLLGPQQILSVSDVTTYSAEAYYYYITGVDYYYKQYESEAVKCFRKALQHDSTFAMAYYYLAALDFTSHRDTLIAKALAYADSAGEREQRYIRSGAAFMSGDLVQAVRELQRLLDRYPDEKQALYRLGACYYHQRRYREAVASFNEALALDSLYKEPYNFLAYAYDKIGDTERSLLAINRYIALAPDQASPYSSRGDLYALNGRLEDAGRSYRQALAIKPDLWPSVDALGIMHLFEGNYAAAESCFHALGNADDKVFRASARNDESYLLLHQGRLQEALESLEKGIAQDLSENLEDCANYKRLMKAMVYEEQGRLNKAVEEIDLSLAAAGHLKERTYYPFYVKLLMNTGDTTKAALLTVELEKDLEDVNADSAPYWCAYGLMEQARGHQDTSLALLTEAARQEGDYFAGYTSARAHLDSHRLAEAVAGFERLISVYTSRRLFYGTYNVRMHYYLGIAYEESRWREKAIHQYETFLNIWKNADLGIQVVADVRARLARLKTLSNPSG